MDGIRRVQIFGIFGIVWCGRREARSAAPPRRAHWAARPSCGLLTPQAGSKWMSDDLMRRAGTKDKRMYVVEGANHMSMYDGETYINEAIGQVVAVKGRIALTLRLICGLTTAEIARAFRVPEKTGPREEDAAGGHHDALRSTALSNLRPRPFPAVASAR